MNKLIIILVAALTLSGCSIIEVAKGVAAQQTAPTASRILAEYIGDDEIANAQLIGPLTSLQNLYEKSKDIDTAQELYVFFHENVAEVSLARNNWLAVVQIVGQYSVRTQREIPSELITWRADVEAAWTEMGEAIATQSKIMKAEAYVQILLKLVAANAGVII